MTTTQLSMLLRDLDDCREPDWILLGICADAMQECEDEDWKGFWWCLERRWWPSTESPLYEVDWWPAETDAKWEESKSQSSLIPRRLFSYASRRLGNKGILGSYPTLTAAFRDVANMLRKAEADRVDVNKL